MSVGDGLFLQSKEFTDEYFEHVWVDCLYRFHSETPTTYLSGLNFLLLRIFFKTFGNDHRVAAMAGATDGFWVF